MKKQYLVIHEYVNIEPAIYLLVKEDLPPFLKPNENKRISVFEFDLEKIKSSLQEVELELKIKEI